MDRWHGNVSWPSLDHVWRWQDLFWVIIVSGKVLLLVLCLFPWATGEACKAAVKVIPQM